MPVEWAPSGSNLQGNDHTRNCCCYKAARLLQHAMKMLERLLENRLCKIVTVNTMQFGFMPERETIAVVFILRRLQEEYHAKGKSCICVLRTQ